jgi:hypothetical protein
LGGALKRTVRRGIVSLPTPLRVFADVAIGGLSDIRTNWHQSAYLARGRLLDAANEGSLIYFGQLPQYKSWIANFFSDAKSAEPLGSFSLLDIARRKGVLSNCDVLLCPTNPLSQLLFTAANGWLVVPRFVKCLIDLRRPVEQLIFRHAAKDDLRIVRKKNYRFEVLRDDAMFDEFYHEMLVPTTRIRHEERANISAHDTLRSVFRQGYLLAAYQGNEWVGANLMVPQAGKVLNWANIGWRGGSVQLMRDRLASALMYEMILRAKKDGYDTLDLGSCNPFVNDGPLNYKLKWGAHMALPLLGYEDEQLQGMNAYFSVHFNLTSESARSMLKQSPILDRHNGHMRAVGWDSRLRSDFQHQLAQGLTWTDLAKQYEICKAINNTPISSS